MIMTKTIEPTMRVEELVTLFPAAVSLMLRKNLPCLVCGEPVWGTVEDLAKSHGWTDQDIVSLVEQLNKAHSELTPQ